MVYSVVFAKVFFRAIDFSKIDLKVSLFEAKKDQIILREYLKLVTIAGPRASRAP